ncbi:DUF2752 domain-containing protein [Streptomyces sp. NPDC013457]|uniref:DUF2752 domain-containing protein n=1 Tax=Streptomyces sp. NPDC013457 TaxID=3364866 RepID=UPI00370051C2
MDANPEPFSHADPAAASAAPPAAAGSGRAVPAPAAGSPDEPGPPSPPRANPAEPVHGAAAAGPAGDFRGPGSPPFHGVLDAAGAPGHVPGQPEGPGCRAGRAVARRLPVPVGVLGGAAVAFAYVGAVDPNEPGHYPVCPLLRFTGLYCPGCGGLRSAHAFVHGDLAAAFGANALAVVGYGLFAVVMALWLIRAVRGVPMRIGVTPAWGWAIGALLALFTLVRNLPFGSALAP